MTKEDFVEELKNFYMEVAGNHEDITDIHYSHEGFNEFVYVRWGDSQKRFSVWGDNEQGILFDFVKFLQNHDNYPWLPKEEQQ